ncbi:hypothetical protein [Embleya sp. MST-111070]|uniref:hypothetical protein n=1 Tax=Embleya sp. MST-111070 TaxID=3398231 RepID=UPI003F73CBDD
MWAGTIPAHRLLRTYRLRLRHTRGRHLATRGLAETVTILEHEGRRALRLGTIVTADRAWAFTLFLDAEATTVKACARGVRRTEP